MIKYSAIVIFILAQAFLLAAFQNNVPKGYIPSKEDFKHFVIPTSSYRLNLTVVPVQYTLRMRPVIHDGFPGLSQFTSPSEVRIKVRSIANSNIITMHQRGLGINLDRVSVTNLNKSVNLAISSQYFNKEKDFYTITLNDSFVPEEDLEIYVPYTANISRTENVGIYLGHYVDAETNETRYLSTTKLEPYHARKVLPLFDEPSLKATWKISVGRLDDGMYHSLSNMEIESTEPDVEYSGWAWDHYQLSVKMSSYLICVIVSDFASETVREDGKNRRVSTWAPRHDILDGGGSYGASTGAKILQFFENKFKIEYPLRKLDAVALPQFASGAMEQWGLITYRHAYLVWIPGENTEAERRKITQVLSHEISHQWYGNLVTCGWWSEIWLNEGFARYLQFWGMHETIPEFKVLEAFVNDAPQLAMAFDQGPNTHALKNSAESPDESASVFDRISYEKGASLLKMMEGFLTREIFESGIIDFYLQKMQWKSAYQDDLFEAIQEAVEARNATGLIPTTIKEIMDSWTLKSGFPVVRVSATDENTISLSQEKFLPKVEDSETFWWVPITVVTAETANISQKLPDLWLTPNQPSASYSRDDIDQSKWLMINPDVTGYYRVLYDSSLIGLIKKQLLNAHEVISSSSRSQLLDDYFNFAFGEYVDIEVALELTDFLEFESASNVWVAALTHLKPTLNRFTEDEESHAAFKTHFLSHLAGALEILGVRQYPTERGINVTLRAQLMEVACQLELGSCSEYAKELLLEWKAVPERNPFPVDLRPQLYCAAIQESNDPDDWQFLLSRLQKTAKESQMIPMLNALACAKDHNLLFTLLQFVLNSDTSNRLGQYPDQILTRVAMNPFGGRPLVYDFVKTNMLQGNFSQELFASTVATLSSYWKRQGDLEELAQIIENHGSQFSPEVIQSLKASIEKIETTMQWWVDFGLDIKLWLQTQRISLTNNTI